MNKKYENPLFEVIKLVEEDIIITSQQMEVDDPALPEEDPIM